MKSTTSRRDYEVCIWHFKLHDNENMFDRQYYAQISFTLHTFVLFVHLYGISNGAKSNNQAVCDFQHSSWMNQYFELIKWLNDLNDSLVSYLSPPTGITM